MKRDKLFFAICCIVMAAMPGNGSAQADSTSVDRGFFNANHYLLQKRHIPQSRTIDRNAKGKNFSIGVFGGLSKQQGEGSIIPKVKEFGISVTKDVNGLNSYRLSLVGGVNNSFKRGGIEVDHIFRIQDYLMGWNADRNFNIETVWGLGFYGIKPESGSKKLAGGVHGGLILSRRMSTNIDVFAEPRINLFSDDIDGYICARRYDISAQMVLGLKYRFTGYEFNGMKNSDAMDNLFYEMYVGTNGDFSDRVWSHKKMKTLGPNAGVAVGKWFYPIGVKATGFGGWRYVPSPDQKGTSEEPYVGVRLEGMVNLNTLFTDLEEDPRFEVNVTGGYEIGALAHKGGGIYSNKFRWFKGLTASLQGLYFVRPDVGLFAQARWSRNDYTQNFVSGASEKRFMKNIGLEIGVQYRRRYEKVEERKRQYAFEPYSWVSAQLGTNFPLQTASFSMKELGQQFSVSYGRRYSSIAAVRVNLEAARYVYEKRKGTYPLTVGGDLMIDALSIVGGYNKERIVNLYPFAGILYTHHETADMDNFGIQGGADLMFRVAENWGVYAEGALRVYKGQITPSARVYTSRGVSFVPNASIGVAYKF